MDIDKLETGELIAGIAGVLLFIIMFSSWFGAPGSRSRARRGLR